MDDLASLDFNVASSESKNAAKHDGKTSFDYLSTSRASVPVMRPVSPALLQPSSTSRSATSTPRVGSPSTSEDAFSSLLGSAVSRSPSTHTLSMAERLRQGTTSGPSSRTSSPAPQPGGAWDFDLLTPSATLQKTNSSTAMQSPNIAIIPTPAGLGRADPDDDFFGLESLSAASASPRPPVSSPLANGPGDVDILGDLARPVTPSSVRSPKVEISRSVTPVMASSTSSRAPSPPPHVLGSLVEMGFGIDQAKTALIATYAGEWNVNAAAEALMGAQEHDSRAAQVSEDANLASRTRDDESRQARQAERRRMTKPRSEIGRATTPSYDDQPDLLAQASEIGITVLNRANAYWKTGRKAVQKAVEERMAAVQVTTVTQVNGNGQRRPKWMTTTEADDLEEPDNPHIPVKRKTSPALPAAEPPPSLLFRDEEEDISGSAGQIASRPVSREPTRVGASRYQSEEPKAYSSPHRRPASQRSSPMPSSSTWSPAPVSVTKRLIVPASAAQLATAEMHKHKGNDLFKLGRYGDAIAAYSTALDALPDKHLHRIALLTNRAQSRLHNGESKDAIEDCSTALVLLGMEEGNMAGLAALTVVSEREVAGKALGRRAKAYEATERWSSALADWSAAQRAGGDVLRGAGGGKLIAEGVARCRRALEPPKEARKAPVRLKTVVNPSGAAVAAVRQANAIADAEDAQRLALKDSVDQRMMSWKGGKEANIRALIASLDTILWDDFGWQKVGLHELVTEAQLKIRYMKAIARLHPDKLTPATTSLEHRMIANGVFGALNDAWNAHKV